MAEGKVEPREVTWRQLMPWTLLFQGFRVALDPSKLLLAAAGILLMALGWWALSAAFHYTKPEWKVSPYIAANYPEGQDEQQKEELAWNDFKEDRFKWNLLHEAAGEPDSPEKWGPEDFANTRAELDALEAALKAAATLDTNVDAAREGDKEAAAAAAEQKKLLTSLGVTTVGIPEDVRTIRDVENLQRRDEKITDMQAMFWKVRLDEKKPSGRLRVLPWNEDRGPNPALLVAGQAGIPWEAGHFWDWLLTKQVPVLIEPLVKLFLPVKYFFHPRAGLLTRLYALLVMIWTVIVWAFFGGAITRIAAVQITRQEKIGVREAIRFSLRKWLSFFSAPLIPLLFVGALLLLMIIYGYLHMIPVLGDFLDALLWPLMILFGLGMAVILVGLIGWPLMAATISTEGTDSWEAVSRAYSYVYQAPWQYAWYSLVALGYGAVLIFFVGLMGSLMVYLSKWGVSQTPGLDAANRNPSYLFVYAPKSFQWRELLLQGYLYQGEPLVEQGEINQSAYEAYLNTFRWWNYPAAVVVSIVWVGLIFMLTLGFGYSYFWSASTIIYLLMRRKVDDAELDEVYLEEEDEGVFGSMPPAPPPAPASEPGRASLNIVEAPRPVASPVSATPLAPPPPAPPPPAPPEPAKPSATTDMGSSSTAPRTEPSAQESITSTPSKEEPSKEESTEPEKEPTEEDEDKPSES